MDVDPICESDVVFLAVVRGCYLRASATNIT